MNCFLGVEILTKFASLSSDNNVYLIKILDLKFFRVMMPTKPPCCVFLDE